MKQAQFTLDVESTPAGLRILRRRLTDALKFGDSNGAADRICQTYFRRIDDTRKCGSRCTDRFENFFDRAVPQDNSLYTHTYEGKDDMPAHIRTVLTNVSVSIPVTNGRAALGTWQAVYLCEHRNQPHIRHVVLHLIGE